MGWIWGGQSTPADASTAQAAPPARPPPPKDPGHLPDNPHSARDESAEAEMRSVLEGLEAGASQGSPRPAGAPPATGLSLEDELLQTEMSCRQAFDAAFYCQSLGGQFNNLYRYGGIRSCSQHWKDFWLCMRLKSYPGEQKEDIIRAHYKKKSLKYKLGSSSEDVWESRDKKLEWGEAFSEPVEAYVGSDEEWNRLERMRREGKNGTA